jgi:SDR family mycofactocin-dependent oxidoreductase
MKSTRRKIVIGSAATAAGLAATAITGTNSATAQQPNPTTSASQPSRNRLTAKVAFITGAARGVGRATALAMAREGADIVAVDIARNIASVPYPLATVDDLAETETLVKAAGRRCLTIQADVREMTQMRSAVEQAIAQMGKVDILVANAGILSYNTLDKLTDEQIRDTIDVDLIGAMNSLRAVIPHMTSRKQGRIVAVASDAGRRGLGTVAHYCAAKWGVIGMVKAAALELGPSNITVNAVAPTTINTKMLQNDVTYRLFRPDLPNPDANDILPVLRSVHPMPTPWVEPEDVANSILLLVSDEMRFISGVALGVGAGRDANYMA